MPVVPIVRLAEVVRTAGLLAVAGVAVGAVLAVALRWRGLAWSWALPTLLAVPVAVLIGWQPAIGYGAAAIAAAGLGVYLHGREVLAGGDLATRARQRRGITDATRARVVRRRITDREWATDDGVAVGQDRTGAAVRIPVCGSRAAMILAAGATGSGKTVTMALMALAAIRRGFGVVVVDPKPDDFLWQLLDDAARRAGRRLTVWSPDGGSVYNPYQVGTDTEIADKILSPETFTEPHYQRLAQRYLGHVVRSLRAAEITVSLATIHQYMQPGRLSALARQLPDEKRLELLDYLETLTAQQERDLAGTRDRLAILAESDVRDWLDPRTAGEKIDLRASLENGDIVLFRLDSDRRPLATGMLASAVIQDLVAISADRQHGDHRPGSFSSTSSRRSPPRRWQDCSVAPGERSSVLFSEPKNSPISSCPRCYLVRRDPRSDPRQPRRARLTPPSGARLGRTGGGDRRHPRRLDHDSSDRQRDWRDPHWARKPHPRTGVPDPPGRDQAPRSGRPP